MYAPKYMGWQDMKCMFPMNEIPMSKECYHYSGGDVTCDWSKCSVLLPREAFYYANRNLTANILTQED